MNEGRSILSNLEQTASSAAFDRLPREDNDDVTSSSRKAPFEFSRRGLQLLSWLAPVVLLIVWEVLAQAGWLTPQILPAPSKVIKTAFKLATAGSLLNDLGVSLARAAAGFAIGGSVGFFLGGLVGFSRVAEAAIDRSVQMIRAIPFLAVLPLVIVWLGVGEAEKIFLVALGVTENPDIFAQYVVVERDAVDANRVNAYLPVDVVNQLRVFAANVTTFLQYTTPSGQVAENV